MSIWRQARRRGVVTSAASSMCSVDNLSLRAILLADWAFALCNFCAFPRICQRERKEGRRGAMKSTRVGEMAGNGPYTASAGVRFARTSRCCIWCGSPRIAPVTTTTARRWQIHIVTLLASMLSPQEISLLEELEIRRSIGSGVAPPPADKHPVRCRELSRSIDVDRERARPTSPRAIFKGLC